METQQNACYSLILETVIRSRPETQHKCHDMDRKKVWS